MYVDLIIVVEKLDYQAFMESFIVDYLKGGHTLTCILNQAQYRCYCTGSGGPNPDTFSNTCYVTGDGVTCPDGKDRKVQPSTQFVEFSSTSMIATHRIVLSLTLVSYEGDEIARDQERPNKRQRGSFLSLSRTTRLAPPLNLAPQTDLYLVSQCVALSVPMFALRPLPGGLGLNEPPGFHDSPSPTTIQATVSSIQWSYESKIVCEATFQDLRSIRLRGNVPLAFDSDVRSDPSVYMGMYVFERPPYDGLKAGVEVTYKTFPGYRFLPTKGNLTTVNGQTNAFRTNRRIQIHQVTDDDPQWEFIIHELGVPCLDQQLGLDQLTVVFDHQARDGRLPDSVDWQNVEWGFTKPPIQGWALSRLLTQSPDMSDAKLQPLYDATARLTDFWMDTRRGNTSRLPFWAHDEVVDKMVTSIVFKHLSEWGLATEEIASPHYESDGYWRGPIWAPSTHLVESGLRDAGRVHSTNEISMRFLQLWTYWLRK
ncbi:hypothetical protein BDP67DRAFT_490246 [Colletotrichum lupini]|nr:hypothetical protein BDP67DRAFT_490246 [Colletotrichum lupini]